MANENLNNLLLKGRELMEKGEYKKAAKRFDEVLKTDPNNADGYFGKAEASVGIPKASLVDVAQWYRMAIKNDPENAYYYSVYGDFCLSNGLLPQAEENFLKAIELDAEGAVFHYLDLANGYYRNGILFLERQLNLTREDIVKKALEFIFNAYSLEPKKGLELVKTLSETKSGESEINALINTDEYKIEADKLEKLENVDDYKSYISSEPNNPYNYLAYGQFCFENGLISLGKEQYLRAIELDPFVSNQSLYYNELAGFNYKTGLEVYKDPKSSEFIEKITKPSLKYSINALGIAPETVLRTFKS